MNSTTILNLFISYATLLPGDPTDYCLETSSDNDASCHGGLASVASVMRRSQNRGEGPSFHVPHLDRVTKFVQMHPSGLGVNRLISHDRFGWDTFIAPPSIYTENLFHIPELQSHHFSPVLTNQDIPSTSPWAPFVERVHFDHDTGASFFLIRDENQPMAAPAAESLVAALDYVAELNKESGCDNEMMIPNNSEAKFAPLA